MFGAYFVIALVIGHLATQLREREQSERRREERATALYRLTRALAASRDLDEALPKVFGAIKETFQADAAVWMRDESGLSSIRPARSRLRARMKASPTGRFKKNRPPENRQTRCRTRNALHLPLVTGDRAEGVLAVRLPHPPTLEQRELLDAFAAQLALFVNKERALEESRDAQVARQSERLQKALFDSVSHELKTPLAAMSVALQQPRPDRCGIATGRTSSHSHRR